MPYCNTTLATEDVLNLEQPLFANHPWTTFHHVAETIAAVFGLIAICVSLFLMLMHMTHYSRPREQRHIIRVLFMVPIYAVVSYLSIIFYRHSVYYEVLRDCYEAFAIASFFSLLCAYIAPDLHSQKEYFRTIKPKNWILPLNWFQKCSGGTTKGPFRVPRSGLTWFNIIWVAVFQYCFIRVAMTIVAVLSQYWDRYCLESLNPAFAHIWVMCIEGVAVTITMYCLIQFYIQVRSDIPQYKPLLKVISIKLVIFLSFWQTIIISFLTSRGVFHATAYVAAPDIKVTLPSLILCIEMACFAVFHVFSFPWRPYVIGTPAWQATNQTAKDADDAHYTGVLRAMLDCFNPIDLIRAIGRSAKWLVVGRRKRMQDPSYNTVEGGSKLNEMTAYAGATTLAGDGPQKVHEQQGLMQEMPARTSNVRADPKGYDFRNKTMTHASDSSGSSDAWNEVDAKDYLPDQKQRRQERRHDGFSSSQAGGMTSKQPTQTQTHSYDEKNTNPYQQRYYETAGDYTPPAGPPRSSGLPSRVQNQNESGPPPYPIGQAISTNETPGSTGNNTYTISNPPRVDSHPPEVQGRPPSVLQPGYARGGVGSGTGTAPGGADYI